MSLTGSGSSRLRSSCRALRASSQSSGSSCPHPFFTRTWGAERFYTLPANRSSCRMQLSRVRPGQPGQPVLVASELYGEHNSMSKLMVVGPLPGLPVAPPRARPGDLPITDRRPADVEMARVLNMEPHRFASDPSSGAIAYWKHGAVHDVVEPMTEHVVMTYIGTMQRMERRSGRSLAIGTTRAGTAPIMQDV